MATCQDRRQGQHLVQPVLSDLVDRKGVHPRELWTEGLLPGACDQKADGVAAYTVGCQGIA